MVICGQKVDLLTQTLKRILGDQPSKFSRRSIRQTNLNPIRLFSMSKHCIGLVGSYFNARVVSAGQEVGYLTLVICPWASGRSFVVDPHCLFRQSLWASLKCPFNLSTPLPTMPIEMVRYAEFIASILNGVNPRHSDIATWKALSRNRVRNMLLHMWFTTVLSTVK